MSKFLADENFPHPSFRLLVAEGVNVLHVGIDFPSISDNSVIKIASDEQRILLTLDSDHGELIFGRGIEPPPGVIYFRIPRYRPAFLGEMLLDLISKNTRFEGLFTVVMLTSIRQRPL